MSATQSALQRYAQTVRAIKEHIQANSSVFNAHQNLVLAEMDARSDLEDAAVGEEETLSKEPLLAHGFRVVVMPQEQTVFDEEKIAAIEKEKGITLITKQKRPARVVVSELKD